MSGRIYAIMLNTFREAVRSKVLYAIVFFSLLLIASSLVFGELALYEQERTVKDIGLVTITLFGALIAVYTGVSLLYKEIEKKTIYTILSKPIERWHFLLGKYGGIVLTVGVALGLMAIILVLLMWARGIAVEAVLFKAFLLIFVEVSLLAALALLFSSFSTPFLSGLMTALIFGLGHLHPAFEDYAYMQDSALIQATLKMALLVLPNLDLFNQSQAVVHSYPVSWSSVGLSAGYGMLYTTLLLLGAALVMRRRDFI